MIAFSHLWPWIGLGLAVLLLAALLLGDLRRDRAVPRTRDMVWLAWAAVAAYLLHQFEEHGVDAQGTPYAFRGLLCAATGFADAAACPIPEAFITAVNIPVVWLAGPIAALLGRRWPALALSWFSVPAVNAFAHIVPAVTAGTYVPGLLTAVLLFLPLSLWTFGLALRRPDLGWPVVIATIVGGVAVHAVLMLSLKAYLAGWLGETTLIAVQIVNPAIPILLVAVVARRRPLPT
ncbi:HXXEE domain-containing protein [Sphingosinicella sp. CPCC 101087]|uniref:HXXEE domain-containing protein n=1 Tax=Sphingosinicella sp. CPCC 101087 TaxID=2497754 RepID=UPI00197D7919|nr:HXXEE domain-containing protein [Sphingosinicella sp. CPCC 101087]